MKQWVAFICVDPPICVISVPTPSHPHSTATICIIRVDPPHLRPLRSNTHPTIFAPNVLPAPGIPLGLTALAIPVLIHLFQLRRFKRIDFPNVRFLAEISQQTRARKKMQHWLVLLGAVARPRLFGAGLRAALFAQCQWCGESRTARGIPLVDDSYSMDGRNAQGRLLDQARKGAQDAVMAYSATDRFQVLTGQFGGKEQSCWGAMKPWMPPHKCEVGTLLPRAEQSALRQREALASSEAGPNVPSSSPTCNAPSPMWKIGPTTRSCPR
jgi:hypothetical protein